MSDRRYQVKQWQLLLVSGLLCIVGVILSWHWFMAPPGVDEWWFVPLCTVPSLVLLLLALIHRAARWNKTLFMILFGVMTLTYFLCVYKAYYIGEKDHALLVVRSGSRYSAVIAETDTRWYSKLLTHFPRELPANESPSFFYGRSLDKTILQLRVVMSRADAEAMVQHWRQLAVYEQRGSKMIPRSEQFLANNFRNEKNDAFADLPESFEVLVLNAVVPGYTRQIAPERWQTNYSSGVAVDINKGDVIYWAMYP